VDVELYGVDHAAPFLYTNLALHALGSLILLIVFASATGRVWPVAVAVALFALHPMRVESVAWASARKDVLSLFLLALTLAAWLAYTRSRSRVRYGLALGFYGASLCAKPSVVALPFLLLLLDWWPFRRFGLSTGPDREGSEAATLGRLALEKLPFLGLALLVTALSLATQGPAYNVWGEDADFLHRLSNAIVSCVLYLVHSFRPTELSIVHLFPEQTGHPAWSLLVVSASAAFLLSVTLVALRRARANAYGIVGWLWFLGSLVPALHLVPWGLRVMHDRYTYVAHLGLFLAVSFGVAEWAGSARSRRWTAGILAGVALSLAAGASYFEIGHWRDSFSLFDRALAVEPRNAIVLYSRGVARASEGQASEAMADFRAALDLHPRYAEAHANLGYLLLQAGDYDAAVAALQVSLEIQPRAVKPLLNLGNALRTQGDEAGALALFERAVAVAPDSPIAADAHYWLGATLEAAAPPTARQHYRRAIALDPRHHWSHLRLALLDEGRGQDALAFARYELVLELDADNALALQRLAWLVATNSQLDAGHDAVVLAQRSLAAMGKGRTGALYVLAAAQASVGRFADAARSIQSALAALPADAPPTLASELERCEKLYTSDSIYLPPAPPGT